ncbi:hypothetical protein ACLPJG_27010 [Pseudomonas aeruginosa]|jgi:hypothetical protein|uniref:Uncharacterized protein n=3 Tax=Pseudomonas TaxID=286 RepID=A0A3M4JUW7_9PSED|nr:MULTISPECIES: hypothetical protein [Pseudomonas]MCT8191220.1 hypothetical protein [Pseudomonas monteilii]RFP99746.1 hypothetical protein D0O09_21285 [Pseudomonas putida]TXG96978.1 MAG: hypothetical protein E6R08_08065 [Nevskiaceae bacterium]AGZ38090.1 hypothetical protein PVLB_26767 [Pseudomonas sp. VLB120]MDH0760434.1 hypothetical protein [Pseudomonas juntendi]
MNSSGQLVGLPPFANLVIRKLQRFDECAGDGQGADIGTQWFDVLTQLGLLKRVQRSPAQWQVTEQGEQLLELRPGAQHSEDAVRVEAVAVTRADVDGLRLEWLLEGGIAALEHADQVLLIAHGSITDEEGGGEVFLKAPAVPSAEQRDMARVYDVIGLHHGHPVGVLLTNLGNIKRFSDYLGAVERAFFMVPGEPSDEAEDAGAPIDEECLLNKFPATSTEHYVDQFREALITIGALPRNESGTSEVDELRSQCSLLRAQLAELPAYIAALEKFRAEDGDFVRLADVLAALSACADRTQATEFRLLVHGEKMLADDQFLADDATTWRQLVENPVFIGMPYSRGLVPVRRVASSA